MSDIETITSEPHNPFLLETFRAFLAESRDHSLAATMTCAHVQHAQTAELRRIAGALETIAGFADPVRAGNFLAFLAAADAKRAATKLDNSEADLKDDFDRIFGIPDGGAS